jgi:hypothetical protein
MRRVEMAVIEQAGQPSNPEAIGSGFMNLARERNEQDRVKGTNRGIKLSIASLESRRRAIVWRGGMCLRGTWHGKNPSRVQRPAREAVTQ